MAWIQRGEGGGGGGGGCGGCKSITLPPGTYDLHQPVAMAS